MIETSRPVHGVVVAFHAADELDGCLAPLAHQIELTVVDNSSSQEVCNVARRRRAQYIDAGGNLGFAAGVNLALRQLSSGSPRDVLLLNPDAVLTVADLKLVSRHLHGPGNERVSAVSPHLVGDGGVEQRVLWPFPTPWRACAEAVGLRHLRTRRFFAIGAVLVLRWEAVQEVGLFDERFFLYAEEADWQKRAADLGWSSKLCPSAVATHSGAGTSTDPLKREALFHAAHETYIRKWYGPRGWFVYRSAACIGAFARALVLVGERRTEATRRALLYLRGPRRCAAAGRD